MIAKDLEEDRFHSISRINFALCRLLRANCKLLMAHFAKGYGKGNWGWRILRCLADTRRMEASHCSQAADAPYKGFWRGKGFLPHFSRFE